MRKPNLRRNQNRLEKQNSLGIQMGIMVLLFCLLGEISLWGATSLPYWSKILLPLAFLLSFFVHLLSKALEEFLRQSPHWLLFLILFLCCLYYHSVNFPYEENSLEYLLLYSMALSALFCFWDSALYLYIFSSFLLLGRGSLEVFSLGLWSLFLVLLVFVLAFHNDFIQFRNLLYEKREKYSFSWKIPGAFGVLVFLLLLGLSTSTYAFMRWMENQIEPSSSATGGDNPPKGPVDKGPGKRPLEGDPKKLLLPPMGSKPQIRFGRDLRFGDIEIEKISARALFEIYLTPEDLQIIRANWGGLFWKGTALDRYSEEKGIWYLSPQQLNQFSGEDSPLGNHPTETLNLELILSPGLSPVIFTLGVPRSISYGPLWRDREGNLFSARPFNRPLRYTMISSVPRRQNPQSWDLGPYQAHHLFVPARYRRYYSLLARQITRGSFTPYQKARAIERFLQKNYTYELKPGIPEGRDATYSFLFRTKRGYCQHFASAMTFLLRTLGIPSRMVIGFKGGSWDEEKYLMKVTNLHGHAWVEARFNPVGWYPFDPVSTGTPGLERQIQKKIQEALGQPMATENEVERPEWESPEEKNREKNSSSSSGDSQKAPKIGGISEDPKADREKDPPPVPPKKDPIKSDGPQGKEPDKNPGEGTDPPPGLPKGPKRETSSPTLPKKNHPARPGEKEVPKEAPKKAPKETQKVGSKEPQKTGVSENPKEKKDKEKGVQKKKKNFPSVFWSTFFIHFLIFSLLIFLFPRAKQFIIFFFKSLLFLFRKRKEGEEGEEGKSPLAFFSSFLKKKKKVSSLARDRVLEAFHQLSQRLKRIQLSRYPSETASEYGQILTREIPGREKDIQALTYLFLKARYSPYPVMEKDALEAELYARWIEEALWKKYAEKK